jgi:hypothetical protein
MFSIETHAAEIALPPPDLVGTFWARCSSQAHSFSCKHRDQSIALSGMTTFRRLNKCESFVWSFVPQFCS